MNAVVEVKKLNKSISGKHIIKNVDLELFTGQITGFLGPNGAGKTTTIRMMTGLMKPSSGDVLIDGKSITKNFEEAIANVGVIVENPEMYKFMSGYKNLLHFSRMYPTIPKNRIDEVVKQVGLEKRIHEKVATYSLGMRQRLGLAQALLNHPKFLILDEPTNGLDPAGIKDLREHLKKLAKEENVSIIVSSHLLAEIELMCDRIAIIQNGKITNIREINIEETSYYLIELEGNAEEVFKQKNYAYTVDGNTYKVQVTREQIPELVSNLTDEKVTIFNITAYHESLEEQFLSMTGDGQIDEAPKNK